MSGFILLQERSGEKKRHSDIVPTRTSVAGGELLLKLPPDKHVHPKYFGESLNYSLYSDPYVALHDDGLGVRKLTETELQYLAAITYPETRLSEFKEAGKLDLVKGLRIGDEVLFRHSVQGKLKDVSGTIQYCGSIPDHAGIMFGIEIEVGRREWVQ